MEDQTIKATTYQSDQEVSKDNICRLGFILKKGEEQAAIYELENENGVAAMNVHAFSSVLGGYVVGLSYLDKNSESYLFNGMHFIVINFNELVNLLRISRLNFFSLREAIILPAMN